MADILYTYHDSVYVNLTNKCDCACTFCIRSHHDTVGESAQWGNRETCGMRRTRSFRM